MGQDQVQITWVPVRTLDWISIVSLNLNKAVMERISCTWLGDFRLIFLTGADPSDFITCMRLQDKGWCPVSAAMFLPLGRQVPSLSQGMLTSNPDASSPTIPGFYVCEFSSPFWILRKNCILSFYWIVKSTTKSLLTELSEVFYMVDYLKASGSLSTFLSSLFLLSLK